MGKISLYLKQIVSFFVIILQMVLGAVVIHTGYKLATGDLYPGSSMNSDPITPLFIIILGVYFCFAGLLRKFFGDKP